MNQINLHNYEAYLLDYSEGDLSSELQMELELFLIQYPELGIDLSELATVTIDAEQFSFNDKQQLKKTSTDLVSETQFVAYVENQLSSHEKLHVEKSCLHNQTLAKELSLYQQTISKVDTTITYPNKSELKRKAKIIWFNFSATQFSAAASVLFIIGLFVFWPQSSTNSAGILVAKNDSAINRNNNTILPHQTNAIASNQTNKNSTQHSKNENQISGSIHTSVLNSTNNPLVVQNNTTNNTNPIVNKDSLKSGNNIIEGLANTSNNNPKTNPKAQTIVETITENDDDVVVETSIKKKKGIWSVAEKTLRNLNNLGVKAVDGDEEKEKNKTAYALTLGGLNITHKTAEHL
jgi:hypothetical protein